MTLEVGMPVRLVSHDHMPSPLLPVGSEGMVIGAPAGGEVRVRFFVPYRESPWLRQSVNTDDLEVVYGGPI